MIGREVPNIVITPHDSSEDTLALTSITVADLEPLWPLSPALRETMPLAEHGCFDSPENLFRIESGGLSVFGVYIRNRLLGFSALWQPDEMPEAPFVTQYITDPDVRGRGNGRRIYAALANYAYAGLHCEAVGAQVLSHNLASRSALERAGFYSMGIDEEPVVYDGNGNTAMMMYYESTNPYTADISSLPDTLHGRMVSAACHRQLELIGTMDIQVIWPGTAPS